MNINLVLGAVLFIIILLISLVMWANWTHKLWSKQPIFRIFNIKYHIYPPGIIKHTLPSPNKLCDFFFTQTIEMRSPEEIIAEKMKYKSRNKNLLSDKERKRLFLSFSPDLISEFVKFLRIQSDIGKTLRYLPSSNNLVPYFENHSHPCYLTVYTRNIQGLGGGDYSGIQGYITSRPLEMWLDGYSIIVYFMDYLCVKRTKRKTGITAKLIQSHIYKQRHKNKTIDITLFKKSKGLQLIVPFIVYITYGFDLHYWKLPKRMHTRFNILRINKENFYYCREILQDIAKSKFSCCFYSSMANIATLINTGNLIVYALLENKEILALYLFKDPRVFMREVTTLDKNVKMEDKVREKKIIHAIGSINNCENINLFILGFHHAIFRLRRQNFETVCIDNISNNDVIIENILTKYTPNMVKTQYYYFHNFAYKTKKSNDSLIVC